MNRCPTHPGKLLCNMFDDKNIDVVDFVKETGVDFYLFCNLLLCNSPVTEEIANILAKYFDMTPEAWLNAQKNYDKWVEEYEQRN